jgi:hypothetical protein
LRCSGLKCFPGARGMISGQVAFEGILEVD